MTSVSPGGVTTSAVIVWRWLTSRTRCLRTLGRTTSRDADSEHEFWTRSRQATPSPRAGVSQMVDYATGEPPRVAVEHPVEMSVEARPCTAEDIERLRTGDLRPLDLRHHQERWASQQRGEAVYLLAWRGAEVFGRVTLLLRSKYEEVRQTIQDATEMNALEARPQGEGIGTALIQAAELEAARRGASTIGLAVEVQNDGARRLYERLGYTHWGHGRVVDRWMQRNDHGDVVIEHADECFYLTKRLGSSAAAAV